MYFADDIYDCFTKMCNWGKTPIGGARSPFWIKKKVAIVRIGDVQ